MIWKEEEISATQIQENVRYVLSTKTAIRMQQIGAYYRDTKAVSTVKELEMIILTIKTIVTPLLMRTPLFIDEPLFINICYTNKY